MRGPMTRSCLDEGEIRDQSARPAKVQEFRAIACADETRRSTRVEHPL